jgi:hypothetical protein
MLNENKLGLGKLEGMRFHRKFRWGISARDREGNELLVERFVRVNARPNIKIEEIKLEPGQKTWIPGKAEWDQITITQYDGGSEAYEYQDWMNVFDFNSQETIQFELNLYDGCGCCLETWTLNDALVTEVHPDDLEGECTDITIRYNDVVYENKCTPFTELPQKKLKNYWLDKNKEPTKTTLGDLGLGPIGGQNIVFK